VLRVRALALVLSGEGKSLEENVAGFGFLVRWLGGL
jgi:hypothetical protein